MLADPREELICQFRLLEPWKYRQVARYIWHLSYNGLPKHCLEFWLCEWRNPFNPMRLKIRVYDVNALAYETIYFTGFGLTIGVHLGEQQQYIFTDSSDDVHVLFECKDFDFCLREIDFDEI